MISSHWGWRGSTFETFDWVWEDLRHSNFSFIHEGIEQAPRCDFETPTPRLSMMSTTPPPENAHWSFFSPWTWSGMRSLTNQGLSGVFDRLFNRWDGEFGRSWSQEEREKVERKTSNVIDPNSWSPANHGLISTRKENNIHQTNNRRSTVSTRLPWNSVLPSISIQIQLI